MKATDVLQHTKSKRGFQWLTKDTPFWLKPVLILKNWTFAFFSTSCRYANCILAMDYQSNTVIPIPVPPPQPNMTWHLRANTLVMPSCINSDVRPPAWHYTTKTLTLVSSPWKLRGISGVQFSSLDKLWTNSGQVPGLAPACVAPLGEDMDSCLWQKSTPDAIKIPVSPFRPSRDGKLS